ncbi:uncharacterized protein MYCFIDRAFT_180254 [Pseudocercospora fijiensis CIRAD86]|uniref:Uncharacterized protein n=1 Tax=Pseudocercospora fijiensis (strain CIRAD86) TaxID=383855 RepID=M2ZDC0_PSEFD|nr:uncharacterized protein MYCFIDRAFT_180254 [Pseudocercospora fijiensis CIRAD86]EME77109.1 hypothetical protein MYCFIDRAFT_180254 [Pseudocercospora fijiensis CIRAD86]
MFLSIFCRNPAELHAVRRYLGAVWMGVGTNSVPKGGRVRPLQHQEMADSEVRQERCTWPGGVSAEARRADEEEVADGRSIMFAFHCAFQVLREGRLKCNVKQQSSKILILNLESYREQPPAARRPPPAAPDSSALKSPNLHHILRSHYGHRESAISYAFPTGQLCSHHTSPARAMPASNTLSISISTIGLGQWQPAPPLIKMTKERQEHCSADGGASNEGKSAMRRQDGRASDIQHDQDRSHRASSARACRHPERRRHAGWGQRHCLAEIECLCQPASNDIVVERRVLPAPTASFGLGDAKPGTCGRPDLRGKKPEARVHRWMRMKFCKHHHYNAFALGTPVSRMIQEPSWCIQNSVIHYDASAVLVHTTAIHAPANRKSRTLPQSTSCFKLSQNSGVSRAPRGMKKNSIRRCGFKRQAGTSPSDPRNNPTHAEWSGQYNVSAYCRGKGSEPIMPHARVRNHVALFRSYVQYTPHPPGTMHSALKLAFHLNEALSASLNNSESRHPISINASYAIRWLASEGEVSMKETSCFFHIHIPKAKPYTLPISEICVKTQSLPIITDDFGMPVLALTTTVKNICSIEISSNFLRHHYLTWPWQMIGPSTPEMPSCESAASFGTVTSGARHQRSGSFEDQLMGMGMMGIATRGRMSSSDGLNGSEGRLLPRLDSNPSVSRRSGSRSLGFLTFQPRSFLNDFNSDTDDQFLINDESTTTSSFAFSAFSANRPQLRSGANPFRASHSDLQNKRTSSPQINMGQAGGARRAHAENEKAEKSSHSLSIGDIEPTDALSSFFLSLRADLATEQVVLKLFKKVDLSSLYGGRRSLRHLKVSSIRYPVQQILVRLTNRIVGNSVDGRHAREEYCCEEARLQDKALQMVDLESTGNLMLCFSQQERRGICSAPSDQVEQILVRLMKRFVGDKVDGTGRVFYSATNNAVNGKVGEYWATCVDCEWPGDAEEVRLQSKSFGMMADTAGNLCPYSDFCCHVTLPLAQNNRDGFQLAFDQQIARKLIESHWLGTIHGDAVGGTRKHRGERAPGSLVYVGAGGLDKFNHFCPRPFGLSDHKDIDDMMQKIGGAGCALVYGVRGKAIIFPPDWVDDSKTYVPEDAPDHPSTVTRPGNTSATLPAPDTDSYKSKLLDVPVRRREMVRSEVFVIEDDEEPDEEGMYDTVDARSHPAGASASEASAGYGSGNAPARKKIPEKDMEKRDKVNDDWRLLWNWRYHSTNPATSANDDENDYPAPEDEQSLQLCLSSPIRMNICLARRGANGLPDLGHNSGYAADGASVRTQRLLLIYEQESLVRQDLVIHSPRYSSWIAPKLNTRAGMAVPYMKEGWTVAATTLFPDPYRHGNLFSPAGVGDEPGFQGSQIAGNLLRNSVTGIVMMVLTGAGRQPWRDLSQDIAPKVYQRQIQIQTQLQFHEQRKEMKKKKKKKEGRLDRKLQHNIVLQRTSSATLTSVPRSPCASKPPRIQKHSYKLVLNPVQLTIILALRVAVGQDLTETEMSRWQMQILRISNESVLQISTQMYCTRPAQLLRVLQHHNVAGRLGEEAVEDLWDQVDATMTSAEATNARNQAHLTIASEWVEAVSVFVCLRVALKKNSPSRTLRVVRHAMPRGIADARRRNALDQAVWDGVWHEDKALHLHAGRILATDAGQKRSGGACRRCLGIAAFNGILVVIVIVMLSCPYAALVSILHRCVWWYRCLPRRIFRLEEILRVPASRHDSHAIWVALQRIFHRRHRVFLGVSESDVSGKGTLGRYGHAHNGTLLLTLESQSEDEGKDLWKCGCQPQERNIGWLSEWSVHRDNFQFAFTSRLHRRITTIISTLLLPHPRNALNPPIGVDSRHYQRMGLVKVSNTTTTSTQNRIQVLQILRMSPSLRDGDDDDRTRRSAFTVSGLYEHGRIGLKCQALVRGRQAGLLHRTSLRQQQSVSHRRGLGIKYGFESTRSHATNPTPKQASKQASKQSSKRWETDQDETTIKPCAIAGSTSHSAYGHGGVDAGVDDDDGDDDDDEDEDPLPITGAIMSAVLQHVGLRYDRSEDSELSIAHIEGLGVGHEALFQLLSALLTSLSWPSNQLLSHSKTAAHRKLLSAASTSALHVNNLFEALRIYPIDQQHLRHLYHPRHYQHHQHHQHSISSIICSTSKLARTAYAARVLLVDCGRHHLKALLLDFNSFARFAGDRFLKDIVSPQFRWTAQKKVGMSWFWTLLRWDDAYHYAPYLAEIHLSNSCVDGHYVLNLPDHSTFCGERRTDLVLDLLNNLTVCILSQLLYGILDDLQASTHHPPPDHAPVAHRPCWYPRIHQNVKPHQSAKPIATASTLAVVHSINEDHRVVCRLLAFRAFQRWPMTRSAAMNLRVLISRTLRASHETNWIPGDGEGNARNVGRRLLPQHGRRQRGSIGGYSEAYSRVKSILDENVWAAATDTIVAIIKRDWYSGGKRPDERGPHITIHSMTCTSVQLRRCGGVEPEPAVHHPLSTMAKIQMTHFITSFIEGLHDKGLLQHLLDTGAMYRRAHALVAAESPHGSCRKQSQLLGSTKVYFAWQYQPQAQRHGQRQLTAGPQAAAPSQQQYRPQTPPGGPASRRWRNNHPSPEMRPTLDVAASRSTSTAAPNQVGTSLHNPGSSGGKVMTLQTAPHANLPPQLQPTPTKKPTGEWRVTFNYYDVFGPLPAFRQLAFLIFHLLPRLLQDRDGQDHYHRQDPLSRRQARDEARAYAEDSQLAEPQVAAKMRRFHGNESLVMRRLMSGRLAWR